MKKLSGAQRKQFETQLRHSFPKFWQLEQFIGHNLDGRNLREIVSADEPLTKIVFDLVNEAIAQGWVEQLLVAAVKERPDTLEFSTLAVLLDADIPPPPTQRLRAADPKPSVPEPEPPDPPEPGPRRPKAEPAPPMTEPEPAPPAPVPEPDATGPDGKPDVAEASTETIELPAYLALLAKDYVDQMRRPDNDRRTLVLESVLDSVRRHDEVRPETLAVCLASPDEGARIVGVTLSSLHPHDTLAQHLLVVARQPLSAFEEYHAIHALLAAAGHLTKDNCLAVRSYLLGRLNDGELPIAARALARETLSKLDRRPADRHPD